MKQNHIKALLPANETDNAKNLSGTKELVACYKIIDKMSEKLVLVCKVWVSKNGQTFYANVWFDSNGGHGFSGHGTAGGWGYDNESHSIGDALENAGIEFRGTPYPFENVPDFKKKCSIRGTGFHEEALMSVAYACGYNNCIFVGV